MANIRAMVVTQAANLLPEDRYVNTFHFSNPDPYIGHADTVAAALGQFFEDPTDVNDPVGAYIAAHVIRDYEIRTYDLSQSEPRVPRLYLRELPAANASTGLPEECCVVMSFRGAPPVTGRRRGRVYLGPLTTDGIILSGAVSFSTVNSTFRAEINAAAQRLAEYDVLQSADWCIRSSVPAENFVPVVGGWVDGAPDTQRRRGAPTLVRDTWAL